MQHQMVLKYSRMASIILAAAYGGHVNAQAAGSTTVAIGWVHVAPQGDATPLTVESIGGVAVNRELTGTGGHASSSDTAGISVEHYFTDNIGLALLAGLPIKTDLMGDGTLQKYGKLGSARPMPPVVEVRYHMFAADAKFRPYIGLGVNYTWFTQVRVTNNQFVTDNFGPGGSARATLSSSWNPVFEIGANYAITKHWSTGISVNYIPLKSNLTLEGTTASGTQIVSRSKLGLNPINVFASVAYTF